jgi:phosphoglycerate dehydrogenase-like enzyme
VNDFRVALSGDFLTPAGGVAYPMFDLRPLTERGVTVTYVQAVDGAMSASDLEGFDVLMLLLPRFVAASVPKDGRLKMITRFGVGYDSVDVGACTRAGIGVATAPEAVRRPVAATVITFVLALAHQLFAKDRLTRMGPSGWTQASRYMGTGLQGRVLGQLGVGGIGAEVFRLARPFGLRFIAHDPYADPAAAAELGVQLVDLETLFSTADFLSVSVPLSTATKGLVGRELLARMKPTAFLINTSRGPVVDQRALYEALAERRIAGAGLDVFEVEPVPVDEPLLKLDNVIVTPHALCFTDECFANIGATNVRTVLDVMDRKPHPHSLLNNELVANGRWLQ